MDGSQELRPSPWALYGRGLAAAARNLNPRIDNDVRRACLDGADDAQPPASAASAPLPLPAPPAPDTAGSAPGR